MRKLKIIEHISLDGVIQAPGGPNEDDDYPYGGWTLPYRDPAAGKAVLAAHSEPFDLLLGRRTYDIWSVNHFSMALTVVLKRPRSTTSPSWLSVQ
jgi:dihydrofolate reductase